MSNKNIGIALLITLTALFLTAIFEPSMAYETSEALYFLTGLGVIVFGISGSIRLIKG